MGIGVGFRYQRFPRRDEDCFGNLQTAPSVAGDTVGRNKRPRAVPAGFAELRRLAVHAGTAPSTACSGLLEWRVNQFAAALSYPATTAVGARFAILRVL